MSGPSAPWRRTSSKACIERALALDRFGDNLPRSMDTTDTLARRLGTTAHVSGLLRKASRLGLHGGRELCVLAVQRGCRHYAQGDEPAGELVSRKGFTDEELAIALLDLALPYDPWNIRCGAAMLGSELNDVAQVLRLARWERSEAVVRYVAEAGHEFEPENTFWKQLLTAFPVLAVKVGVLPHPTRFVGMSGLSHGGPKVVVEWQRPTRLSSCV